PIILERKKIWIADALKRATETRRFLEPRSANYLPNSLQLRALGETWAILYRENEAATRIQLRAVNGELILSGSNLTRDAVIRKLKSWLRLRVRDSLFLVARNLANNHRMDLRRLLVKSQRTRWASCSAQKNLSLNTKLLFLSPELVRYVLIHE